MKTGSEKQRARLKAASQIAFGAAAGIFTGTGLAANYRWIGVVIGALLVLGGAFCKAASLEERKDVDG